MLTGSFKHGQTWLTCVDLVSPEAEHDAAGGEGQLLKALVLHTGTIYFYVILKKYMKTTSPAWLAGGGRVWAGLPSCRGRASPSRPWSAARRPGWGWRRTGGGRARAGRRCAAAGPGWAGGAPAHSSFAADTQYTIQYSLLILISYLLSSRIYFISVECR